MTLPGDEDRVAEIRKAAESAVAATSAKLGASQPESVTVTAINGFPVQALIDASKNSDLLVVGTRGGGGFGSLVLGSVSSQVAHHSSLPSRGRASRPLTGGGSSARGLGWIFRPGPELAGRLDGVAVRVPVEDGSLTDLTAVLGREVTAGEVNDAFRQAAEGPMAGILRYSTDPLVSRDIIGDPASCVFDSGLTQAAGSLVKIFGWYDNEWGYTCRLADLAALVGAAL